MPTLTRKPSESINIGSDVTITALDIGRRRVRIGIDAPKHVQVDREELRERIPRKQPDADGNR